MLLDALSRVSGRQTLGGVDLELLQHRGRGHAVVLELVQRVELSQRGRRELILFLFRLVHALK